MQHILSHTPTQLPLSHVYAFTFDKSQGQSLEYAFIDIGDKPAGSRTGAEYTEFSRITSLSGGLFQNYSNERWMQMERVWHR